jgi:hypothetical protein
MTTSKAEVEVSYQLTRNDIAEAVRPFVRRFVLRFWMAVIVVVIVAEILLWLVRMEGGESNYALSWFTVFLGIIWLPIGRWLGLKTAVGSVDPYAFEETTFRADGAGVQVERETGKSAFPWTFFGSWRESENLVILTHGKGTYIAIPNRAFTDDGQRAQFVTLVESEPGSCEPGPR